MLVLKGIFAGSSTITSENKITFEVESSLKIFLGFPKGPRTQNYKCSLSPGLKIASEIGHFKQAIRRGPIICGEF